MDDIHSMMESPWTYILFAVLVLVVAVTVVGVRLAATREKRGGDPRDDRHLG